MRAFAYIAPTTIEETTTLLAGAGSDASILAGGTDLLVELRRPKDRGTRVVIDISGVKELGGMTESAHTVVIGPLATHARLQHSSLLAASAPLLAAAAASIGSPQIRNRGTIGGNIMNAAACADTVPPLVALGAAVTLRSAAGTRQIPLADLFLRPYQTTAAPEELLTEIRFPALGADARSAFIKLGRRNALSIARLSVAAVLRRGSDGRITEARIVPGAAFPRWQRVAAAEELLLGELPSARLFAEAGACVSREMILQTGRRWSTEYKEPVIAVLVRRALEQCALAGGNGGGR